MEKKLETLFKTFKEKLLAAIGKYPAADPEAIIKAAWEKFAATGGGLARQETYAATFAEAWAKGWTKGWEETQARATEIIEACALAGVDLKDIIGYVKDTSRGVDEVRSMVGRGATHE